MEDNLQIQGAEEVTTSEATQGVEATEPATQSEPVNPVDEGAVEETKPEIDINAIYAQARRKAEAEAKEKMDKEAVRRFGNYKNPITNQPIRSQEEYYAALDAQEKLQRENELRSKGVDPAEIERYVQNSPAVREANEYLERMKQEETMKNINSDIAELSKFDPNIKDLNTVPREVVEKCVQCKISMVDAYKILNFGKVTASQAEAIRQNAVNQAKGKNHLQPMNGVATANDGLQEIPQSSLRTWQNMYPDLSMAELKKKYNQVL